MDLFYLVKRAYFRPIFEAFLADVPEVVQSCFWTQNDRLDMDFQKIHVSADFFCMAYPSVHAPVCTTEYNP